MKFRPLIAASLAIPALALLTHLTFFDTIHLRLSDGILQEEVSQHLPMAYNAPDTNVLIDSLQIIPLDGGVIQADVGLQVSGRGLSGSASGRLKAIARLEEGQLMLHEIESPGLDLLFDTPSLDFIAAVTANSSPAWARFMARGPRWSDAEVKTWTNIVRGAHARLLPGTDTLLKEALSDLVLFDLATHPMAASLPKGAVTKITVEQGSITLAFDPQALPLQTAAGGLLLFALLSLWFPLPRPRAKPQPAFG